MQRVPGSPACLVCGLALLLAGAGCSRPPADGSRAAEPVRATRAQVVEELRADLLRPRSPSDGGGVASVEALRGPAVAGRPGSWRIVYTAGPLGVATGGSVHLQVSPFWGWSPAQTAREAGLGYTTVATEAAGLELAAEVLDQGLLVVTIGGRRLREGEQVEMVYGAGPAGALADRYADRESRFWVAVDGDGDGIRELIAESPAVDVLPGPPARLLLHLPSTARPGEQIQMTVAVVDAVGNGWPEVTGEIELLLPPGVELVGLGADGPLAEHGADGGAAGRTGGEPDGAAPDDPSADGASDQEETENVVMLPLAAADRARMVVPLRLAGDAAGAVRLRGRLSADGAAESSSTGPGSAPMLEAESNPMVVSRAGRRILWADLQNHSGLSDGSGTPDDLLRYAREVAGLDAAAVTDHDHWGMRFMDAEPAIWQRTLRAAAARNEPGRFVALAGYEWTNWVAGHRHVVFFEASTDAVTDLLLSAIDERHDEPEELWAGLAESGLRALTFAHHSAGEPITTDWSSAPPADLEPVVEIVSVHGASEATDAPGSIIRGGVPGHFVRDALDRGYRLGFVGSSDGHDGHPGMAHLAASSGGVAAILSENLSREGILEALLARRTYATNGPRIVIRASYAGWPMGADIPAAAAATGEVGPVAGVPEATLVARVVAPGELERIDVVSRRGADGRGEVIGEALCPEGERECRLALALPPFRPGGYLYLRAVQSDGGAAWTSPFFFR